jgi:hypothetical protein
MLSLVEGELFFANEAVNHFRVNPKGTKSDFECISPVEKDSEGFGLEFFRGCADGLKI